MGVYARDFMSRWNGHWLVLVDPYLPYPEMPWMDRTLDMMMAVQAMAPYHGRVRFIRAQSWEAAAQWPVWISRPQFVYVDGSHEEKDVAADLVAWWDLLDEGSMLSGHDFDDGHPGVVAAVTRFAEERGLVVRVTAEQTSPPSWYIYKGEPERLVGKFFRDDDHANPHAAGGA